MTTPDQELEARLRAELQRETQQVTTDPGALQMIQQRTRAASTPFLRRPWVAAGFGAALATAATITGITLVGNDDSGRGPQVADETTAPTTATDPTQTLEPTQTVEPTTPTSPTGPTVAAMHPGVYNPASQDNQVLYYLGEPGRGEPAVRLYTEPHTTPGSGGQDPVAAVRELLTSTPIDADYTRGWPEGVDVEAIRAQGGVTTFELFGDADLADANGLDPQAAQMAIQAIGRTGGVTGGSLSFTYNGEPVTTVLGVDVSEPVPLLTAELDYLALNHIESIVEGQVVSNPVTVTGRGTAFEGNLNWILYDASGKEIRNGFTQTGSMGDYQPFTIELGTLAPGTYTIETLEYSMEDGSPELPDNKTFTVQ